MKKPKISFSGDKALGFLLHHGEKVVVAIFGLAACGLAWGGVTALRTMTPTRDQQPKAIVDEAASTAEHIEAVKIAPDAELTAEKGLAATVARWLSPQIVPPPPHADLNKPLFRELSKRGSPEILPVEDLRTFAGMAILAVKARAAPNRVALDGAPAAEPAPPQRPGKPPRGGRDTAAQPPPDPAPAGFRPDTPQAQGKIVPYVIVTGLIPVAKQKEEFDKRFQDASFRDPVADVPAWMGYQIEKTEVIPGIAEKWTPVDMRLMARRYASDWAGIHQEPLLTLVSLPPEQERRDPAAIPIPFCSPLPQVVDRPWGFDAIHPRCAEYLLRDFGGRGAREDSSTTGQESGPAGNIFGNANPGPGGFPPGGFRPVPGAQEMPAAGPPGPEGTVSRGPDYRMFRFIDLAVAPGRTYRYRVSVTCWNPNYNVNIRHLSDPGLAKTAALSSPPSAPTAPTLVPDGIRMLAQPMPKDLVRKLKPGVASVTILGPNPERGGLALRSVLTEVGGLANVDPQLNKKGDVRFQGDAIVTDRVLLDMRGRPEDRAETRTGRPTPPPEPLEMIFLRPDGTFEASSAADSQADLIRYGSTEDDEAAAAGQGAPPRAESPFGNPFAPQK